MKPKFKPTPKKIIASTIDRDYTPQKLRPPIFEDVSNKDISYGALSDLLEDLASPQPIEQSIEEQVNKNSFWVSIKRFIPNSIAELVTAQ